MAEHRPTDTLLELLRQALADATNGLAPRQLLAHLVELGEDISRPTLNRLLTQGVDQGLWSPQGQGRAVVYVLGQVAPDSLPSSPKESSRMNPDLSTPDSDGKPKAGRKATAKQVAKPASQYDQIRSVVWGVADTLRDKTGLQVEAYQPVTLALMILKRNLDTQAEMLRKGGKMQQALEEELPLVAVGLRTGKDIARRFNAFNRFWGPELMDGERFGLPAMTWSDLSEFETNRNEALKRLAMEGKDSSEGTPVTLVLRANPAGHDTPDTALFTYTTSARDLKSFVMEVVDSLVVELREAFGAIGTHSVLDSQNEHSANLENEVLRDICTQQGGFRDFDLGTQAVPSDVFSDVYMDLLGRFGEASGKRGGEYFTPTPLVDNVIKFQDLEEVARVLSDNPSEMIRVADPTAGSNTFLIRFYDMVVAAAERLGIRKPDPNQFAFYAQELKNNQVGLGVFNMSYHGLAERMNLTESEIDQGGRKPGTPGLVRRVLGNSISEYVEKIGQQAGNIDFAFGNPPYGVDDYGIAYAADAPETDKRWMTGGGVPTRSEGEWAFHHIFTHLLREGGRWGRSGVIMPLGILFRDGGANFRRQLIENDWLEGIIAAPSNQFLTTSIPVCVVILNKNKKPEHRGGVFFINATEDFTKVGKFNHWDVERALDAWKNRSEIPGYSGFVTQDRLLKAPGCSLAVNRWFAPIREKKVLDPRKMAEDVAQVRDTLAARGVWMERILEQASALWSLSQDNGQDFEAGDENKGNVR